MNITPSHATFADALNNGAPNTLPVTSWNPEKKNMLVKYPVEGLGELDMLVPFSSIIELTFPNCVNELV